MDVKSEQNKYRLKLGFYCSVELFYCSVEFRNLGFQEQLNLKTHLVLSSNLIPQIHSLESRRLKPMNTYTDTWLIGTKRVILGLLTISALGIVSLPARADDGVIQQSIQESVNTGDGNTSIQNSYQESRINRRSRRGSRNYEEIDTGVVQKNEQVCDQLGVENLCIQNTDQRSRIRHRRGR